MTQHQEASYFFTPQMWLQEDLTRCWSDLHETKERKPGRGLRGKVTDAHRRRGKKKIHYNLSAKLICGDSQSVSVHYCTNFHVGNF